MGVVVRRYIDISIILLIPTPLVLAHFCSSILTSFFFFFNVFRSCLLYTMGVNNSYVIIMIKTMHTWNTIREEESTQEIVTLPSLSRIVIVDIFTAMLTPEGVGLNMLREKDSVSSSIVSSMMVTLKHT